MKSSSMSRQSLSISLLVLTLAMLPGCAPLDWIKKQFSSDEKVIAQTTEAAESATADMAAGTSGATDANVLVSMDGKPVVTLEALDQNYKQVIEERPDLAKLESCVKESLLQGLVRQAIVDRYVQENDIQNSAAYQKDRDTMAEHCKKILNVKYFREAHPVVVKESEVKEYYENNKDTFPDLIIERGGIDTKAVSFEKEADAKAFLAKAKAASKDFDKLAQEYKSSFRDFKSVNARTPDVDPAIKNAVLELKSFPTVQMVKSAGNLYWVVNATGKKESKYRPFDEQIKEGLRQYMAQEREAKVIDEEMAKLKEKYNVVINAAALNQTAQAQFNFEDAFGMIDAQMAEAEQEDAAKGASNQSAIVA